MSDEHKKLTPYRDLHVPEFDEGTFEWRKQMIEAGKLSEWMQDKGSYALSRIAGVVSIRKEKLTPNRDEIFFELSFLKRSGVSEGFIQITRITPDAVDSIEKDYGDSLDELLKSFVKKPKLRQQEMITTASARSKAIENIFKAEDPNRDTRLEVWGITKNGFCSIERLPYNEIEIRGEMRKINTVIDIKDQGLQFLLDQEANIKFIYKNKKVIPEEEKLQYEDILDVALETFTTSADPGPETGLKAEQKKSRDIIKRIRKKLKL